MTIAPGEVISSAEVLAIQGSATSALNLATEANTNSTTALENSTEALDAADSALTQVEAALPPLQVGFPAIIDGVINLPFPSAGNAFYQGQISEDIEFTFSGGTTGKAQQLMLVVEQNSLGGNTFSFGNNVVWSGSSAPNPPIAAFTTNVFLFIPSLNDGFYIGIYFGSSSSAPTSTSPNFFALF
jgi:hypothetical protein